MPTPGGRLLTCMLEPVRRTTLREEAAVQIKTLILEGRLQPGDRLPSERDLVARLGVSRASIREALRSLEIRGLLDVRRRRGRLRARGAGGGRPGPPVHAPS